MSASSAEGFEYNSIMAPMPPEYYQADTPPQTQDPANPGQFREHRFFDYVSAQTIILGGHPFSQEYVPAADQGPESPLNFLALWANDGSAHATLRDILGPYFTPAAMRKRAAAIRRLSDGMIDHMLELGGDTVNVVETLCKVPRDVIALEMGVPLAQSPLLGEWLSANAASGWAGNPDETPQRQYIGELLAERRDHPQDQWLDALLAREGEEIAPGFQLTDWRIAGQVYQMLTAGTETTGAMIATVFQALTLHGLMRAVQDNPELRGQAIEEVLRAYPSFPATPAVVTAPHELHGVRMEPGELAIAQISAANRDPQNFPDPHRFDIYRGKPLRHLSFGVGAHNCLGSALARLELQVVLNTVLERLPGIEWAEDMPATRVVGLYHQPTEGYVRFDRAAAGAATET